MQIPFIILLVREAGTSANNNNVRTVYHITKEIVHGRCCKALDGPATDHSNYQVKRGREHFATMLSCITFNGVQ